MFQRTPAHILVIGLVFASCQGGGDAGGEPEAVVGDARSADLPGAADLAIDVDGGPPPLVFTAGDALRPAQEGDLLALLTIDAGGTICLSQPWNEDCTTRVRLMDLTDGSPVYSSTEVYATSIPLLEDKVLFWTGPDNRLRYHEYGAPGIVQPLVDHPDFYGIQTPVLVRDGGIYWYAYDYGAGTYAFHRYDITNGAVTRVGTAQHDFPWFLSDLGAPPSPQFDISADYTVWLNYQPYGDTWHYRINYSAHGDDVSEELPTGDVNCIWPRIRGPWVYYLWFSQEHWECNQFTCIFHISRVHVETGEVEDVEDADARITGLYPPLTWEGGVGWIDYREGTYRVVLRPDDGEPAAVTPRKRPVGLYSGVDLVPLEDGGVRILWSTLYDGRLQVFAEDWTP